MKCATCGKTLARLNKGDQCFVCQGKYADGQRLRGSIPSRRTQRAPSAENDDDICTVTVNGEELVFKLEHSQPFAIKADGRKLHIRPDDTLIVNGYAIDAAVLMAVIDPKPRVLWAFMGEADGERIQPVAFSEANCIWLQNTDLSKDEDIA